MSRVGELWSRRWVRVVVKTALGLVAVRVLVTLLAPLAISFAARSLELRAEYDELSLSVFSGSAQLSGLAVRAREDADDAPPMLAVGYGLVDVSMLSLLRGELHVERAEIDDVHARVERRADGCVPWVRHLGLDQPAAPKKEVPKEPQPLDFTSPVRIDALRALRVGIELVDASVTPAIDEELVCELRISDLGAKNGVATFEASATSPRLLGSAHASGRLRGGPRELSCDIDYALDRFHAKPLSGWLRPLGLEPIADAVSARGAALATVEPAEGSSELCRAMLEVHSIHVEADGVNALDLGELRVGPAFFSASEARVDELSLVDLTSAAERHANGRLAAAGFELVPTAADDSTPQRTPLVFPTFPIAIERVTFERLAFALDDRAVEPATKLEVKLDSLTLAPDETDPRAKTLTVRVTAPGLFESAALSGRAKLADPELALDLQLDVSGMTLERLRPHLAALGLEPHLTNGTFTSHVFARAKIADGKLADGEVTLGPTKYVDERPNWPLSEIFALDRLAVAGLAFDPLANRIDVASVESSGLRTRAVREDGGALHFVGLRTIAVPPRAPAEAPSVATSASTPLVLPELHLGHLVARANELRFLDLAVKPSVDFTTTPLEVTLDNFVLGAPNLDPDGAKLHGTLAIPGLLETATLAGTLVSREGSFAIDGKLRLEADGVTPQILAPYLAKLGLEPTLERGRATAELDLAVVREPNAWRVSASLVEPKLFDGEHALASCIALRAKDLRVEDSGMLRADSIDVVGPLFTATRDAEGRVEAFGLRLVGRPVAPVEPTRSETLQESASFELPRVDIARVSIDGVAVDWSDAAVEPAVTTRLGFDAKVEPLRIGLYPTEPSIETRATHFSLVAQVGPELPRATVAGTAWLDDGAWLVEAHVGCDRLRAGALAAYLPPGVAVEMENGNARFDASIGSGEISVLGQLANGELGTWSAGRSADVALRDFALTEGDATLAKFDKVELKSAIDLAAGSFEVEALDVSGAELTARRTSDGTLHAAGIALSAAPTSSTPVEATPEPTVATPSAGPTRLALTKGNLELARLEFVDESSGANAEPIVLSARAKIADLVLAGAKASAPPMRVDVEGAAAPFCDRWSTSFVFAEADGEPELDTHFALDGLHGDALTRAWPKLAAQLDGSGLANGTVRASAKMRFRATRRPDRAPDLTQPFGAEIEIGPLELRATPDGEVLAGLEGGRVEIAKIDPKSGDVAIRSIELVKPRGRVRRDAEGVHALGLTLRVPPTAITEAPPSEAPAPELVTQIAAPTTSASELTIDRLSISGLDFELVDATGTPPATVPLVDLDFELRRFSTRALTEPKAFYFNAFVTAGKVDVPRRVESDSLLEGVVDAVGGVLEGEGDEQVTLEQRPLFEEVALAGRITLFPEVRGWVNVGVSSLELSNFRGLAESTGLTLGDGLLDESVRARLQGAQGVSIASRSTFSYLALSEPSGGPISRYLTLPAPLDTVLFLMKDAEDQHKLSVDVRVGADGLSTSELVSAAIGAVTQVIARAVASAPLRLLGAVGGLFGGDEEVAPTDDTLALEYPAGVATLGEREEEQLERLIQRFGDDDRFVFAVQQSLSKADLARAAALANPSADDCRELSARLRRNKSELVRRREELAARARVDYAIGRERESADATLALRGLDRELGSNEDALDRVHELLRPGAERRRDQRTKAALLQVAIERVARLKARLVERGVAADRMEIRSIRATIDAELATGRIVLTPHKRS